MQSSANETSASLPMAMPSAGVRPSLSRVETQVAVILVIGLGLRGWHYFRMPALWHDEAALILNVLDKNFAELLGPLRFSEAAPPLFLWLEKLVVLCSGDGLLALRAIPALAGCATLVLMIAVARRWLTPLGVIVSLLLLACGDRLLWHGCEAKQYVIEAFLAIALVWTYECTRGWTSVRRCLLFAALAPVVIWLAYPGCFLLGGFLLAELPRVWRNRSWRSWVAYGIVALVTLGSFGALLFGPIAAQHDATITACWQGMNKFPNYEDPWTVPAWTVAATVGAFDYCFRPIGIVLMPLAAIGARQLWRKQRAEIVILLAAPFLLSLLGAFLHAYPFGGSRVIVFAAPSLALLIAAGIPPALAWFGQRERWALAVCVVLFATLPAIAVYRVCVPWGRADCALAAEYVRVHRAPGDRIATNHWEYEYYFRDDNAELLTWPAPADANASRLWVVVTGEPASERARLAEILPSPDYEITSQRQFERTTVVLFECRAAMPQRR